MSYKIIDIREKYVIITLFNFHTIKSESIYRYALLPVLSKTASR